MRSNELLSVAARLPSPCFVVDLKALDSNLKQLTKVRETTGCKIIHALKAFANWGVFEPIASRLDGCCASGYNEARLAREEFGGEVHVYSPAYTEGEIEALLPLATSIDFNSLKQWRRFQPLCLPHRDTTRFGLRINPEHSTGAVPLYDPCAPGSRLGILASELEQASPKDWEGISGFHFHTLCEQNSDALDSTLRAVEKKFSPWLNQLEWFNFGGGHHITRDDYDVARLCRLITEWKNRHAHEVYLEPGEAVVLNAGYLITTVLDVVERGGEDSFAIMDISVTAHTPDVLEMPYRPQLVGAGEPGQHPHSYILGGSSCLAGDRMGIYSFEKKLTVGQKLIFEDMAHYTMVKTTHFNGVAHPALATYDARLDALTVLRQYGYKDFKQHLG